MSTIRWVTTTLASGALLFGGVATAPAALADGPDTPPEVIAEIEAMEWPEYALGDSDTDIAVANYLLRHEGFLDSQPNCDNPEEEFTEELEDAVLEYQKDPDIDLPETGKLDEETWENLRKRNFDPALQNDDIATSGDHVCGSQYSLVNDYDKDLNVDGLYGTNTKDAVAEVQEEFGIDADGLLGVITFRAMIADGA